MDTDGCAWCGCKEWHCDEQISDLKEEIEQLQSEVKECTCKDQFWMASARARKAEKEGYKAGVEDAAQVCRYYLKHQNFSIHDKGDFTTAVVITCNNVEKAIMEGLSEHRKVVSDGE